MGRLYLVDSYNVILQDFELNEILDYDGLAGARRALREVAGDFARRTGSKVRLVFDGAQDPFSHVENSEDEWLDVSFTSTGEKADERLVAIALECRRRGLKPTIVSDDVAGIREPLAAAGFPLLASAQFARMMRAGSGRPVERRAHALSDETRRGLEAEFLARDAENRRLREEEKKARETRRAAEAKAAEDERKVKAAGTSIPPAVVEADHDRKAVAPGAARAAGPLPVSASPAVGAAGAVGAKPDDATRAARKARGQRKQARRLALLQSRRKSRQ